MVNGIQSSDVLNHPYEAPTVCDIVCRLPHVRCDTHLYGMDESTTGSNGECGECYEFSRWPSLTYPHPSRLQVMKGFMNGLWWSWCSVHVKCRKCLDAIKKLLKCLHCEHAYAHPSCPLHSWHTNQMVYKRCFINDGHLAIDCISIEQSLPQRNCYHCWMPMAYKSNPCKEPGKPCPFGESQTTLYLAVYSWRKVSFIVVEMGGSWHRNLRRADNTRRQAIPCQVIDPGGWCHQHAAAIASCKRNSSGVAMELWLPHHCWRNDTHLTLQSAPSSLANYPITIM